MRQRVRVFLCMKLFQVQNLDLPSTPEACAYRILVTFQFVSDFYYGCWELQRLTYERCNLRFWRWTPNFPNSFLIEFWHGEQKGEQKGKKMWEAIHGTWSPIPPWNWSSWKTRRLKDGKAPSPEQAKVRGALGKLRGPVFIFFTCNIASQAFLHLYICNCLIIPVVPHEAVPEVSKGKVYQNQRKNVTIEIVWVCVTSLNTSHFAQPFLMN